jgi:enterochelin esterase-like enzyme
MLKECTDILFSPRLQTLGAEIAVGDRSALEVFWQEIQGHGTPLVEPIPRDDQNLLVTFLWRAEQPTSSVTIVSSVVGFTAGKNQMTHLPQTDVLYKSCIVRKDTRTIYWLAPNTYLDALPEKPEEMQSYIAAWRLDPLNPHRFEIPANAADPEDTGGLMSVLELPDAVEQPWIRPQPNVPSGNLTLHSIASDILGNKRRVWVYTPSAYATDNPAFPFLILFDGWRYLHAVPTTTILDNLIAAGAIPPLIAIFIDCLDQPTRTRELTCSQPFIGFLADELLPQLRQQYNLSADPTQAMIAGSSYGGLAAVFAALQRPDLFGNALSQSGTFWWKPDDDAEYEWLTRQFVDTPQRAIRLYLEIGLLEGRFADIPSPLEANRHLRDVLKAKEYELHYVEYSGGHDYLCWRGSLATGLMMLTSRSRVPQD